MVSHLDKLRKAIEARAAKSKKVGGAGRIASLSSGAQSEVREVIPTGILPLDWHVLGCGGWPLGRISEVFSEEGLGKTSLLLLAIANAQQAGGLGIFIDSERSFDAKWAELHGVDPDRVILIEPDTVEQAMTGLAAALDALNPDDGPYMVGWDSLAAATPKAELEGTADQQHVGVRSRLLNQAFRKLGVMLSKKRAHLQVINQVRFKIGVMFGDPTTTPGGQALKHHASIRLRLSGAGKVEERKERSGQDVKITAVKNKLHPPHRWAICRLRFAKGWDPQWTLLEHAKEMEVIKPSVEDPVEALKALGWSTKPEFVVSVEKEEKPATLESSTMGKKPKGSGSPSRKGKTAAPSSGSTTKGAGKGTKRRADSSTSEPDLLTEESDTIQTDQSEAASDLKATGDPESDSW